VPTASAPIRVEEAPVQEFVSTGQLQYSASR
jgi:hypothetical protein